ncbi:MAG: type VI secretion system baseplate subunit TssF [Bacteroidales bacterium]|nr:type VI secretion system baseplate subunit TssF [Bacteroidales bacterium]
MNTFEDYHKEIIEKSVKHWQNDHYEASKGMGNDPVVNLLLTALSHQAFQIEKNIESYEENMIRNLRDRIIPHHLIRPVPAFSIVETQINNASEGDSEKIIDETYSFDFEKNKKKYTFFPLLTTKIINAECEEVLHNENSVKVSLKSKQGIQNLSGISFYIDSPEFVEVEKITLVETAQSLPLVKPSQYNELPFTKMFNNSHWLMEETEQLFGTHDYWQEVFLTNTTNLYYIGDYNSKDLQIEDRQNIELEMFLKGNVEHINSVKINCIPIVQVKKEESICLNKTSPIKEFETETGDFLNLLAPEITDNENNFEKYTNSFLIRQFGIERYNPKILLQQLQEIADRYTSDYYAFQNIDGLKSKDRVNELKESVENLLTVLKKSPEENNWSKEVKKNNYYAVLRKDIGDEYLYINYLTTSGEAVNGIKKGEVATKTGSSLNRQKTRLLCETKGGRNSISDEVEKENIAKYYFLTNDRLITAADIRAFCHKELGDCVNTINLRKENDCVVIEIKLKEDSSPRIDETTLQRKIELRSTGAVLYRVSFL